MKYTRHCASVSVYVATICSSDHWLRQQILATYTLTEAQCLVYFKVLDRLGVIELRPLNRYRVKVAKTFRWRPNGPVMQFFRTHVAGDFFSAGFDDPGEMMMLVHGQLSPAAAEGFVERLRRVGQDFAQQHVADQKLPADKRRAFTLVVGMRSWLFGAFRDLKRDGGETLNELPEEPGAARRPR